MKPRPHHCHIIDPAYPATWIVCTPPFRQPNQADLRTVWSWISNTVSRLCAPEAPSTQRPRSIFNLSAAWQRPCTQHIPRICPCYIYHPALAECCPHMPCRCAGPLSSAAASGYRTATVVHLQGLQPHDHCLTLSRRSATFPCFADALDPTAVPQLVQAAHMSELNPKLPCRPTFPHPISSNCRCAGPHSGAAAGGRCACVRLKTHSFHADQHFPTCPILIHPIADALDLTAAPQVVAAAHMSEQKP